MTNFKKRLYFYCNNQCLPWVSKYPTYFKSCIGNILAYARYSLFLRTKIHLRTNNTIGGVTYIYEEKDE